MHLTYSLLQSIHIQSIHIMSLSSWTVQLHVLWKVRMKLYL